MKRIYFLILLCFIGSKIIGQTISATKYPFTTSTGVTLDNLTSGATALIGTSSDDGTTALTNIGFDFWFVGVRYTQFSASANGFIRLGSAVTTGTTNYTNALASTAQVPVLAPFWDDLNTGSVGGVRYKLTGTAPNRKLTIEWYNVRLLSEADPGARNFQVWIYETTGVIEFVYGSGVIAGGSYSIGLGSSATVYASITSSSNACSYSAANNANSTAITSGRKYTFTPLIPAAPTAINFTSVAGTSMTVNWTAASPTTNIYGYALYRSTDGGSTYTFVNTYAGATTATAGSQTGLTAGVTYTWKVVAYTEGGLSSALVGSQTTPAPACSGTPTAGTVSASTSISCSAYTSNLSLSGSTTGVTGLTYQWQTSSDNLTWTSVSGATISTYTASVSSSVYYRCVVGCSNSGLSATTPALLLSVGTCYTMTYNGTVNATTCSGILYDDGGPSGNYNASYGNSVFTIYPGATGTGSKVSLTFTAFALENTYDFVYIYDGNSTAATSLGSFTGTTLPGTFTSTASDGSLTVLLYSDGSVNAAGFAANISNTNPTPITAQPSSSTTTCVGYSPSISVTASGTNTYLWYNNGTTNSNSGGTSTGITTASYSPSTATTGTKYYYCVVTNACGVAYASNTAGVTVNSSPSAITGTLNACSGSTSALSDATGGGVWSTSSAIASVSSGGVVTAGSTAGITTVSYTVSGCSATTVFTVNASPGATSGTTSICSGTTSTLSNTGGTGTWTSSNTGVATVVSTTGVVTGVAGGTANISYANGCGSPVSTTVTILQTPGAITGATTSCIGTTIALSNATSGGTWSSSATAVGTINASTGVFNPLSAGTTTITYTFGNGCTNATRVQSVDLTPSAFTITPSSATICVGSSQSLSAPAISSTGSATFSSSGSFGIPDATATGATNAIAVSGIPAGATITSVDVTLDITMTFDGDLIMNLMAPNGNILNLVNQVGGSGMNFTNTVLSSAGVTSIASGTAPYTGTYAISGASSVGPTSYVSNVTAWASLYSTMNGTWTFAVRDAAGGDVATVNSWSITVNYSFPGTYTWAPTTGLYTDAGLTTPYTGTTTNTVYASPSSLTTYTASGTYTGYSCARTATATITTESASAVILAGGGTSCGSATLTASGGSGGTIYYQGTTSGGTSTATPSTSQSVTSTGTYYFRAMTPAGCWGTQGSAAVTVNPTPNVSNLSTAASSPCLGIASTATVTSTTLGNGTAFTVTYDLTGANSSAGNTASVTLASNSGTFTIPASLLASAGATTVTITGIKNASTLCNSAPGSGNTAAFTVNAAPADVTVSGGGVFCGSTTITASGGSGGTIYYQGITSGGTSTATPSVSQAVSSSGTYYFRAQSAGGCWGNQGSAAVTVNPVPTAAPTNSSPICNGGTVTLTANPAGGANTYSWSGPNLLSSTAANPAATPTVTSTYSLTVTNGTSASGCSPTTVYTTSVTVNSTPTAVPTNSGPICNGGTVALTANPGGSTTTYSWSGPSLSSSVVANPTATPTVTSTYSLTVTNGTAASGCAPSTIYTTTVTVNPKPTASPTNDGPICNGGTVNLTANPAGGATTYAWSGPNLSSSTDASPTATPTVTSTYSLTVTDGSGASGCSPTTVYTTSVTVNSKPTAAPTNNSPVCNGGTVNLTANPGGGATTYAWSGPNLSSSTVANPTAIPTVTSTYSLTVTNGTAASGCAPITIYTTTVSVNATPAASPTNDGPICNGGTVGLTANPSGGATTYSWAGANLSSSTIASPTATPTVTSTYSLTVTNGSAAPGCSPSTVYTTTVTVNAKPTAAPTNNGPICNGGTVTLTANPSGGATAYAWTGPNLSSSTDANPTATPTVTSTYSLMVTNGTSASGCSPSTIYTTTVTVRPTPVAAPVNSGVICNGGTVSLTANPSGGAAVFVWSGMNLSSSTVENPTATPTVTGTYSLTVSDGTSDAGCSPTTIYTTTVTVNPMPAAAPTNNGYICNGGTVSLMANPLGGASVFTWSGAGLSSTTVENPTANLTATGTYTLTVSDGSGNPGCSPATIYTTTVTVNAIPTAAPTNSGAICAGGAVTLSANAAGGATSYSWSGVNLASSTVANPTATPTVTGVYSLTVSDGSGQPGCSPATIYTISVTVNAAPSLASATNDGPICEGTTLNLSANSAANVTGYSWSGPVAITGATSASASVPAAATSATGTYTVTVNNGTGSGCAVSYTTAATVNILPTVASITPSTTNMCTGTALTLNAGTATGGGTVSSYNWSGPNSYSATTSSGSAVFTATTTASSGAYTLSVTYPGTGCISNPVTSSSVTINNPPSVASVSVTPTVLCAGYPISLTGSGASGTGSLISYNWAGPGGYTSTTSGTAQTYTVPSASASGVYSLSVTYTGTGCTSGQVTTSSITVNALPVAYDVTGGGFYCSGGSGVHVGLSGSETSVNYQLFRGSSAVGAPVAGTGSAIDFGLQTASGTYTVSAVNTTTGCTNNMNGSTTVAVGAVPTVYTMTGGGSYCNGGAGVHIGLSGSDLTVGYQLYKGGVAVGSIVSGTGSALDFGLQTAIGTYSVMANPAATCAAAMNGTSSVSTNPLPTVNNVTGGGTYCSGGTGVHIGMDWSVAGINYQLYNGATAIGSAVAGSSSGLDFGLQTAAGTYTVLAANATTGCTNNMASSATISINVLPTAYAVTGTGSYCADVAGLSVGLSNTNTGINYQLYSGATMVGTSVAGTGSSVTFGTKPAGTYSVLATNTSTGCTNSMSGSAVVTMNNLPTAYAVTGGGNYCTGGSGYNVGLGNSATGINYQLYNGATAIGSAVAGTGAALDFGVQATVGTYTVHATNSSSGCANAMAGNAVIVVNSLPVVYTVTGGGNYCAGGSGAVVGLSNSEAGTNYQLYNGAAAMGSPVAGSGVAISFGPQTISGTYTVVATNAATSCTSNMTGSATVGINSAPTVYTVTGGGSFCAGAAGVNIGLSNSGSGINYQLYRGTAAIGSVVAGTGSAISFGTQGTEGTYTVSATNASTGCTGNMSSSATVTMNALPATFSVTGGGNYCTGGSGVNIGLVYSNTGINYQLYNGASAIGSAVAGTNAAINFGLQTTAGTYTVLATNASTGCSVSMTGSASVIVNPLPAAYTVTGGGNYCAGGAGVHVGMTFSASGINYQLFNGGTAVGTPVSGSSASIDFGAQTAGGTYSVAATNPTTGCSNNMSGSATVSIDALPTAYTVTGSGSYCAGGSGVNVGLSNSAAGISYQLYRGTSAVGSPVAGTGSSFSFGAQTTAGTYTVLATNTTTGCTNNMTGSAAVSVNALPAVFNVTGGGSYCTGGTSYSIGLSGSAAGINYQLYNGSSAVGGIVAGTGSALNFGVQSAAGTYTVLATNASTACTSNMSGSATIVVNSLPTAYTVTGGGNYCSGGTGMAVGLSNSTSGINYQLYNGSATIGSPVAGTGAAISFGTFTATGIYTVFATNASTGCTNNMSGSATIGTNALPTLYTVNGGGNYCSGGTGLHVGLSNSTTGISYQLYIGSSTVGSAVPGTGAGLDFGILTAAGTYTVRATNTTTGCASNMSGSTTININSLPTAYTVTGGGSYCNGGTGINVGLGNSNTGINYQLYRGATVIGSPVAGTGAAISFGLQTTAGTYSVLATSTSTTCSGGMSGTASVTVNPLPGIYAVTGGGNYCVGGTGVNVGLANSNSGINYQLYNGSTAVGSAVAGTGAAFNFGLQTTAGTYTVVATNASTSCASNMSGSSTVTVNPLPTAYTVTGGGNYCSGGTGASIGLNGSNAGVNYQLYLGATALGSPVAGTGGTLSFGPQTSAGTYSVVATNSTTGCISNMTGTAAVAVNSVPAVYAVTGGGNYCNGSSGVHIGTGGSSTGINYQLYLGTTTIGSPVAGTGSSLDFGFITGAGTYSVAAINPSTGCTASMTGSATVVVNSLPAVQTLAGGGNFCAGGTGVSATLSGSSAGINYQLYNGASTVGSPVAGTGSALSFGLLTTAGTYTVLAINTSTSCSNNMTGSVTVIVNPLPVAYTVTGGGSFCSGGSGVHVGVSNSENGINYQLYRGATAVGSPVAGASTSLDFGLLTSAGTYSVAAVNAATGCASNMSGSATVVVNALPVVYTVSGGGNYCAGGAGLDITLSSSAFGINYQLYRGTTAVGGATAGIGTTINFGPQAAAGTYSLLATNATTGCASNMSGTPSIGVNALPTVYTVTGGGNYCSGGSGVAVGLSGSTGGISYQLYRGAVSVGAPVIGSGSAISFGLQTGAGSYSVVATNAATLCSSNMTGSTSVIVNTTPSIYTMTGGGSYCAGGNGMSIGLDGSATGVNYQLYNGTSAVGIPVSGTGSALSFGLQTTAGTYSVLATSTTSSCANNMAGTASISVNALPIVYDVTGGGAYCEGGAGVSINLAGSASGINYQLYRGTTAVGSPVAGTGGAISFGLQAVAGAYTVVATNTSSFCTSNMNSSASVYINPLPAIYSITGGGSYCTGSTGIALGLSNSNTGIYYQLYNGSTAVGTAVAGTGAALNFGTFTTAGTYSVMATHFASGCTNNMSGTASVSINGLPTVYTVTGGGSYCAGGTGVSVGLSSSASGVNYQLYSGATAIGSPVAGTGSPISFGLQTVANTYTVSATNATTGCVSNMAGSVNVSINALPTVYTVSGGGSYCTGGTGVHVGLPLSEVGVTYQVYIGGVAYGSPIAGTGASIDFGSFTTAGAYTVAASGTSTGCASNMAGSAAISVNPLPAVHTVTGGGNYCVGGSGVAINIDGSNAGINYKLYNGSTIVTTVPGTGASLGFGMETAAGTYTAVAINAGTGCTSNMSGSATVNINSLPVAYTVTGGGSYCSGGNGVTVMLDNSSIGVNYQLLNGTTPIGTPMVGTGTAINFGLQTLAGSYSVRAANGTTGCTSNMSGSTTVSINPLPNAYAVMGGGSYCNGGAGVNIAINGSNTGINYQLYEGSLLIGSAISGTGSPLNFGVQTIAGIYSVVATDITTGCVKNMAGTTSITIDALPTVFTVTGGGSYCNGAVGVAVGLSGSENGINYQLYNGSTASGSTMAGTSSALSFGSQTSVGVYSVMATNTITGCASNMAGSVGVSMNALPVVYNVTGGGNYCSGGTGVSVGLSSSDAGINYQLYSGGSTVGGTVAGTGSAINFGYKTVPGTYTVVATNAATGCNSNMSGSAVVSVNPLPAVFAVTGGGNYCAGGTGVTIGLNGSTPGVSYQLYSAGIPVGSLIPGTGSAISLGLQTAAGTYNVFATNTATGCVRTMAGSVAVGINPLPDAQTVTGGGNYCSGGTGVAVGLANSAAGTYYQLYNGTSTIGGPVAGTGTSLSFGSQTAAGTYSVLAINSSATCTRNMSGTVNVGINPLPAVYAVTGGGSYCTGGNGVHIGLGNSEAGINYQLYNGTIPVGAAVAGTGAAIDFGLLTATGTYSVKATNATTSCVRNMSGSVNVSINALPTVYTVTGGGNYCSGTSGIHVGLSGSASGISYQLYSGGATMGAAVPGTGIAIDFGFQTSTGVYTVVATNTATGCAMSMAGSTIVGITPSVTPSVSVSLNTSETICSGTSTTFTANPVNGGSAPTYVWKVNGTPISTGGIFSYTPANGNVITVVLSSNATCALPDTASSSVTMTVNPNVMPAVIVSVTPNDTICDGTTVTFTATPVYGGTAPTYVWMKNGINVGTGTTYSCTPVNGDVVYCRMTSNLPCRMVDAVNSASITMKVITPPVPSVSILANPGTSISKGQSVTFTAVVTNGGPTPTYQWMVNGTAVSGATLATFTGSNFADEDSVTCQVMSSGPCGGLPSFNTVKLTVSATGIINVATNTIDVRVLPNPNNGEFTVKGTLGDNNDEAVFIEITDMLGQVVYTDNVILKNGNIDQRIMLNKSLSNGMYMLSLRTGTEKKVYHIILEQ